MEIRLLISCITRTAVMERDFDGNFCTDRGNAVESNARCWEELALVRTFSTFPGINNVYSIIISPGFDLMNQNEALAHKSVARCHLRASQLKLWGTLLLIHYSAVCGFISGVGLSWAWAHSAARPKWSPRRRFNSEMSWWEDENTAWTC